MLSAISSDILTSEVHERCGKPYLFQGLRVDTFLGQLLQLLPLCLQCFSLPSALYHSTLASEAPFPSSHNGIRALFR